MKKVLFLFTLLIFFTGCSIRSINEEDINDIIEEALNNRELTANVVSSGYKYYLPRGVTLVDKKDYNSKLLSDGKYYYLYVDAVSYYHHIPLQEPSNQNVYFYKKISYNNKNGYIQIEKKSDNRYLLVIVYNYAKIETETEEDSLNEVIDQSIKILSSVVYNDAVLTTTIGGNNLDSKEEEFDFFDSKRKNGNFLDYVEEYNVYQEQNDIKDEDVLSSSSNR